jgi:N-acetylglucosaminyldiphosphoundecaprenol N-acetyl-beta-D-mannosaminyltransferase
LNSKIKLYAQAMQTINFLDLPLITGNINEVASWLTSTVHFYSKKQAPVVVTHVNANNYYLLCKDRTLSSLLKDNAQILFDGIGMKLAAHFLGFGWLPDLNGTDLFPLVMEQFVNDAIPLYLLGANEFVVARTVKKIRSRWPKVNIVGHSSGFFTETDEDKIVCAINASGAKVLLLGRGFPLQEAFSLRQRTRLNVSLIWNVGGLFDFISEHKPRAPLWMRQTRLEWLFRLVLEPRRLWHRTFVVGPWLASYILTQRYMLTKGLLKKEV